MIRDPKPYLSIKWRNLKVNYAYSKLRKRYHTEQSSMANNQNIFYSIAQDINR